MGFFKRRSAEERVQHRRGLLRVLGFVSVLGVAVFGFRIHVAKAEIGKKTITFGREMLDMANSRANDTHKFIVNGQTLYTASAFTNDEPGVVLARYEKYCEENRAQSTENWRQLADNQAKQHKVADDSEAVAMGQSGGTYRAGDPDREGVVMCFVRSNKSEATFEEAFKKFAATGDMGAVGMIRYVYVKKSKKAGTHVLAAWSTDSFNIKALAPQDDRDVEGHEFDNVPRPVDSQRILAAYLEGTPFGVNVYQSKTSVEETVARIDTKMKADGWLVLDIDRHAYERTDILKTASTRLYEKDGAVLTLVSKPNPQTQMTVTSLGMAGANERETPPVGFASDD